jgi:hypothetical protein
MTRWRAGIRLTSGTRLGVTLARRARGSSLPDRELSYIRVHTTLPYGF